MGKKRKYNLIKILILLFISYFILLHINCNTCIADEKTKKDKKLKLIYIPEKKLPRKVLVLSPFTDKNIKVDTNFKKMIRNIIQNYLSGKGYIILYSEKIPQKIKNISKKEFKPEIITNKIKNIDGFFTITIHDFTGVNVVLLKRYKIDAELCLYKGKNKLGCWRESAKRRKVDIATNPLGLAAKFVSGLLSDSSNVQFKDLVFDWAYQISSMVPSFSYALQKPRIMRVISNIEGKTFKAGERIVVAMEGDPGLDAKFDLGTFKQNIKMIETQQAGIYKGFYTVQKGDEAENLYLLVKLQNLQGKTSEWLEFEPPINIDGIPPQSPKDFKATIINDKIKLIWKCDDGSTNKFEIYRSKEPLSGYKSIVKTSNITYVDKDVKPGEKYFYRIVAIDAAGNKSDPIQIGPITVPIQGLIISGKLSGNLKKGTYIANNNIEIPQYKELNIYPGVTIKFTNKAKLIVNGILKAKEDTFKANNKSWEGISIGKNGTLKADNIEIINAQIAVENSGQTSIKNSQIINGNIGLANKIEQAKLDIKNTEITGFKIGIMVKKGSVNCTNSTIRDNIKGILVQKGNIKIEKTNFFNNEINIESQGTTIAKNNYLGNNVDEFKIKGTINLISYLDKPYPDGKEIKFDKKAMEKEGEKLLTEAKLLIQKGNYGKACEYLEKAEKLFHSEDLYYWLVYTYTMIDEDRKLSITIEKALNDFPYEVKIYQLAIRYYIFKEKTDKALKLINRALKLQPNNQTLESLKNIIERKMREKTKNNKAKGGKI